MNMPKSNKERTKTIQANELFHLHKTHSFCPTMSANILWFKKKLWCKYNLSENPTFAFWLNQGQPKSNVFSGDSNNLLWK